MSEKERELALLKQEQEVLRKDRIAEDSRDRLKKISQTKFETCFIFALDQFEKTFGLLWGHGLSKDKLNDDHKGNKVLWDLVRKKILDKGNTQARALGMEIDLHKIQFTGYKMELKGVSNG